MGRTINTAAWFALLHREMALRVYKLFHRACARSMSENKGLPGDNSETGVLDGVGLCPGGRKCDGDPLFEPPPNLRKKKIN